MLQHLTKCNTHDVTPISGTNAYWRSRPSSGLGWWPRGDHFFFGVVLSGRYRQTTAVPQTPQSSLRGRIPPRLTSNFGVFASPPSPCVGFAYSAAHENTAGGEGLRGRLAMSRTLWGEVYAPSVARQNVAQYSFCWHFGKPTYRTPPVPSDRRAQPTGIDSARLWAPRDKMLGAGRVRGTVR